ncbi:MAG: tetratricopeptide repeat protein [Chitinispirillia bacterium]|nr:tetratricopeptide repeat protein [Chitinispirillia bacterium]MCL2241070.1 tetratricopeptide repeat protein [Chitinispirillia bacterium]
MTAPEPITETPGHGRTTQQNREEAEAHCKRGNDRETPEDAIADYTQAIEADPGYAYAYFSRGFAYYSMGCDGDRDWLTEAVEDFDEAIRLNPDYTDAYYRRGIVYCDCGMYNKAIADFGQAIRISPEDSRAYTSRGIAYHYKGRLRRAMANYRKAVRLAPDNCTAYYHLATAYYSKRNWGKAIMWSDDALNVNPNLYEARVKRMHAYFKTYSNRHRIAIIDYSLAIWLKPRNYKAYCNRAKAYYYKCNLDKAIADYNKAIELGCPFCSELYYSRGLAYENKGCVKEAIADYESALRHNPDHELAEEARAALIKNLPAAEWKDYFRPQPLWAHVLDIGAFPLTILILIIFHILSK